MTKFLFLSLLMIQVFVSATAQACTAFCLCDNKERIIVGKSYDWYVGHNHGAVFVNPRNCQKHSMNLKNTPNPAEWTSKYGSVTFTQFGKGFPIGGMNEKGLVIEMEQLDDSKYNSDEINKPFVNEPQWTQYQLDNYASTEEVLNNLEKLRVVPAYTGIHYFVADAQGNSATIEFIDGKIVVHHGGSLPWSALSNDTYEDTLQYVKENPTHAVPSSILERSSERRFQTAAMMVEQGKQVPQDQLLDFSWSILKSVRVEVSFMPSQWNTNYDISAGEIRFRMVNNDKIKSFNIKDFDFDQKPGKVLNMNIEAEGNIAKLFQNYSDEFNKELINGNRFLIGPTKRNAAIAYGQQECR